MCTEFEGKEDFNSAVHLNTKEEPIEQMLDGQENHTPSNNHVGDSEPTFSDDEEEAAIPATNPIPRSTEDDDDDDDIPLGDARSQSLPVMTLWLI